MTDSLRDALTQFLDGWRDDLSPAWQHLLGDAAPALSAVPTTLQYDPEAAPIRPSRGVRHRFERDDAHTFLALRAVEPHAVRVVIVGQDPYPTLGSATGRSFDDGRLRTWDEPGRAPAMSLKRIVQVLAVARTGDPTWAAPDGWKRLVAAARAGDVDLPAPRVLFDHLAGQGVLCLNAALTITAFDPPVQRAHTALWHPVVARVLRGLAESGQPLVFVLWGAAARAVFDGADVPVGGRVSVVAGPHPMARGVPLPFLVADNPFVAANLALRSAGAQPVAW